MPRTHKAHVKSLNRERVLREFAPVIKESIDHIRLHSEIPLDREDLLAAALTGLLDAMNHYNPKSRKSFHKMAMLNIHRALLEEIRPTADFFQHVRTQPVGAAEATHHIPDLTFGYDWKGHKFRQKLPH